MTVPILDTTETLSFDTLFWRQYFLIADFDIRDKVADANPPMVDPSNLLSNMSCLYDYAERSGFTPSDNDTLDELSESTMRYLLLPFAMGDILHRLLPFDEAARASQIFKAQSLLELFITNCTQLGVCEPSLLKPSEASQLRDTLIKRSQRQALLKEDVAKLHYYLFSSSHPDEDLIRDLYIRAIEYFCLHALSSLRSISQELPMLDMRASGKQLPPPVVSKPWIYKVPKNKSELLAGVFKPDISLPTMSLAEFADMEMAIIHEAEKKKAIKEWEASFSKNEKTNEDDNDEEEAENLKSRKWDDWKDENPRGIGNKNRNIG